MAYDAARAQVVLFGGLDGQILQDEHPLEKDDTWVWDGTNWTQKSPANSPPPRGSRWLRCGPRAGGLVWRHKQQQLRPLQRYVGLAQRFWRWRNHCRFATVVVIHVSGGRFWTDSTTATCGLRYWRPYRLHDICFHDFWGELAVCNPNQRHNSKHALSQRCSRSISGHLQRGNHNTLWSCFKQPATRGRHPNVLR